MKKIVLLLMINFSIGLLYSQQNTTTKGVGINTDQPNAALDVNGNVYIRGKMFLGGTETELGNPGTVGQVLVSQGKGLPPKWENFVLPENNEDLYLMHNYNYLELGDDDSDDEGYQVINDRERTITRHYTPLKGDENLQQLGTWGQFKVLKNKTFEVINPGNEVFFSFETMAHQNTWDKGHANDFVCGIFVDDLAKVARQTRLNQKLTLVYPVETFSIYGSVSDLKPGSHKVTVACLNYTSFATDSFAIGTYARPGSEADRRPNNVSKFMAQSTLKVEVYEIPKN